MLCALAGGACSSKRPDDRIRLTYRLDFEAATDRDPSADRPALIAGAVVSIRARIDARGLDDARVVARGDGFVVELPRLDEETLARLQELITRTAALELTNAGAPVLTGSGIERAEIGYDPVRDAPDVAITFTPNGARSLEALATRSPDAALVVVFDGKERGTLQLPARTRDRQWSFAVAGADDDARAQAASEMVELLRAGALTTPRRLVP